ncbi:unnamed protein product [Rotaria magnacalcarata]|uniref:Uncharacterized protein n=1 Tax=Rotaria magnacalcarata TaxID=392030 RepID=A0A815S6H1_9BILA|nr:unnamed protein product [Rotaria magnacalcarata]
MMIQQNIIQDEPHVKETLLKLCDEIRPNLILTTGGTRNSLYDISPEVYELVLLLFNRLIFTLGDELMKHIGCSNNTILSSNNSCAGIYILELTFEMFYLIIYFNQSIDPRPEYIRVIIIEWSIKSSIPIARIVSLDTQRSLLSARRCKGLYDYSQQTD